MSSQSRCRRTARFWRAAISRSIGGQTRNRIARLDATTGLADSFEPEREQMLSMSIAVQADGKILAGGIFTERTASADRRATASPGSMPRPAWLIRSTRTRTVYVYAIAVQADGKILAGGSFTTLAPNGGATVTRNRIARLETDGRLDQTLDLSTVGSYVIATAVQPDGKILIGGDFTTVLGVTRNNIATAECGRHARHGV